MDPINKAQIPVPGIYRITRDTKNPRVDRRVSVDFNRIEIWKAGTRIGIRMESCFTDDNGTVKYRPRLWKLGQYDFHGFWIDTYPKSDPKDTEQVNAILAPGVLEMEPPSLESELTIRGKRDYYTTLLQRLVNNGNVTIYQVIEALEKKA